MSDSPQPSFFGGLPPRGNAVVAERPVVPSRTPAAPEREPLNRLSLIAFIAAFVVSVVGIVLAVLALRQLRERDESGRRLALAGLLVGLVSLALSVSLFAVFLCGGSGLVANLTGIGKPGTATSAFPTAQPISAAEAKAAKAAIASGGGAVPGHIVSGELCKALSAFQSVSAGKSTVTDVEPAVLASMQALAAVKSPSQDEYTKAASLAKDPAGVPSIVDAQKIVADFAKAVQVDAATCA